MEASSSEQAPSSSGPSEESPVSWVDLWPASVFLLLIGTSSGRSSAALWKESQDQRHQILRREPWFLAVLAKGPPQSDSSTPPLMGSSLFPGQHLCGRRSLQTLVQMFSSLCCLSTGPCFAHWDPTHSFLHSFIQQIFMSSV